MVNRDGMKRRAAEAALAFVPYAGVIGVGAGSTTELFIEALAHSEWRSKTAVAASGRSAELLEAAGITPVALAEELLPLELYVDGADEADSELRLIKGGGGALTREKVLATAAKRFVCIVDQSKLVRTLGAFPLPIEIVPAALGFVTAELRERGGRPALREDYRTDNGNLVVDVHGLDLSSAETLELELDSLPGVVTCGIFARRRADVLLVGTSHGVQQLDRSPRIKEGRHPGGGLS